MSCSTIFPNECIGSRLAETVNVESLRNDREDFSSAQDLELNKRYSFQNSAVKFIIRISVRSEAFLLIDIDPVSNGP